MTGIRYIGPDEQCPNCLCRPLRARLRLWFASRITMNLTCQLCGRKYARAEPRQEIMDRDWNE